MLKKKVMNYSVRLDMLQKSDNLKEIKNDH